MTGDQKGELSEKEKLFLETFSASLKQAFKDPLSKVTLDIKPLTGEKKQKRRDREFHESSRKEYKQKEFDQRDRNQELTECQWKIPSFYGADDPAAYMEWEENGVDFQLSKLC